MTDTKLVYSEVFEILKNIEKQKTMLIPQDILLKIKSNADPEYKNKINWTKPLEEQGLQQDTINIIGFLNYNFWCTTNDAKLEYNNILYNNKYKQLNELNISNNHSIETDLIIKNTEILNNTDSWLKKVFKRLRLWRR